MPQRPPEIQQAVYRNQEHRLFTGNPFIEALPPPISNANISKLLVEDIDFASEDRELPPHLRLYSLEQLLYWRFPRGFQFELVQLFSTVVRMGYLNRNPLHKDYWDALREGREFLVNPDAPPPKKRKSTALGFPVIGDSGVGKTCGIDIVLEALFPQLIIHSEYNGRPFNRQQIPYLIIQCPPKAGLIALCENFFRQVDEILGLTGSLKSYYKLYARGGQGKLGEMIGGMYTVCEIHGIGVLVIDEIQNLTAAKANDSETMLNFFVQLVNELSIPIVVVGTPMAIKALSKFFRNVRRVSGQGDCIVRRMKKDDPDWINFVKNMLRYQFVQKPIKISEKSPLFIAVCDALYWESQGITDLVVKVFILAQIRAITTEDEEMRETLTPQIIHSVRDSLLLLQPMLDALRSGDESALAEYEDLYDKVEITATIRETVRNLPTTEVILVPPKNSSTPRRTSNKTSTVSKTDSSNSAQSKRSSKRKKQFVCQGGVLDAISQGKANEVTPYESLLQAGHIRAIEC